MAAGAGEVAATAKGAGAIRGAAAWGAAAEEKGRAAALAFLGQSAADALGAELTDGGGKFRRTRSRKE